MAVCFCLAAWLEEGSLQRLVLVISSAIGDKEVLERWTFLVETDRDVVQGRSASCSMTAGHAAVCLATPVRISILLPCSGLLHAGLLQDMRPCALVTV